AGIFVIGTLGAIIFVYRDAGSLLADIVPALIVALRTWVIVRALVAFVVMVHIRAAPAGIRVTDGVVASIEARREGDDFVHPVALIVVGALRITRKRALVADAAFAFGGGTGVAVGVAAGRAVLLLGIGAGAFDAFTHIMAFIQCITGDGIGTRADTRLTSVG